MSTASGSTLRDLISQLSRLIKKRPNSPSPSPSPFQKKQSPFQTLPTSSTDRTSNLSKKDLDYIVQQTTKRIIDSMLHSPEIREQFSEVLCNKCSSVEPSNMDISFCSPPKNQRPVLKEIGGNRVEWIVNMHHIRNKTDQLVSKIKDIN